MVKCGNSSIAVVLWVVWVFDIFLLFISVISTPQSVWMTYSGDLSSAGIPIEEATINAGPWKISIDLEDQHYDGQMNGGDCTLSESQSNNAIVDLSSSDCRKWKMAKTSTILTSLFFTAVLVASGLEAGQKISKKKSRILVLTFWLLSFIFGLAGSLAFQNISLFDYNQSVSASAGWALGVYALACVLALGGSVGIFIGLVCEGKLKAEKIPLLP